MRFHQCLWHPEPFHEFRIGCSAKTFNGWLPLNIFAGWLCPTCVTETWVPFWIDVILIWYHYIVICTLVTIFNLWLSSKDMKLQVLIKEVLAVFHWLTFPIILLCSLANGHRALFLVQETTQELLYLLLFVEHSTQVHQRNGEITIRLLIQEHTHTNRKKLQITTNGKNRTSH